MMQSQFDETLLQRLGRCGVVAVLVVDRVDDAVPVAEALLRGGVDAMELTLRTPAALDCLQVIREQVPEMLAGIGTILTPEQVVDVKARGAAFGVAPGLNPAVVRAAQRCELPFAPGILTPSEIEAAIELGCRELKLFPAEPSGGLDYLKSLAAPYAHLGLRFVPLGGLNASHLREYLQSDLIWAVGGSWLAPRDLLKQGDWAEIERRAAEASSIVREVRGG